jgi:hypothetical protein
MFDGSDGTDLTNRQTEPKTIPPMLQLAGAKKCKDNTSIVIGLQIMEDIIKRKI